MAASVPPPVFPALALRSSTIVTSRDVREGWLIVRRGRIESIREQPPDDARRVDLGELALLPGLVDTHVHIDEPGRTDWEGFTTGTRAARAGGITTLVDMPLNSVPATTSAAALQAKRDAARGQCAINVAYWGGVVPGNADELEPLAAAGVCGFKCFMVPSGVDEFEHVTERDLREAMPILAQLGLPLLVHAELPAPIERANAAVAGRDPRAYATWLASRPPEAEIEAIRLVLRLCEETGCRVHIVHLAAAAALDDVRAARERGLPVTVETCPHYLTFAAEDIPEGATEYKCAPPIRSTANREILWQGLLDGDIDLVASDHSPCPPAMKHGDTGDFMAAWGGIASLELGLAAVWTGARQRGATLADVVRWMAERPAGLAGLSERKGKLEPGYDADLIAFDIDARWTVDPALLRQRHKVTPYAGMSLSGRVEGVWLGGAELAL